MKGRAPRAFMVTLGLEQEVDELEGLSARSLKVVGQSASCTPGLTGRKK